MQEARALLRYTLSGFGHPWEPDAASMARFQHALTRHDVALPTLSPIVLRSQWLLGLLDAHTRLRYPDCPLQRCLVIAAAIAETQPHSAAILLPRERSRFSCITSLLWISLRGAAKFLLSIPLLLFPTFLKRNAGIR